MALFDAFRRLLLTFFNVKQWERHKRELRERKRSLRLFGEYLAIFSLVMGLVLLLAVCKKSPNPLESRVQDGMMLLAAPYPDDRDEKNFPAILFIDVDEASWLDPAWGGGEPRAVPLRPLAWLIERAVEQGAKYILTDFVVDGPKDQEMEAFYESVKTIVDGARDRRFLFARELRTRLGDDEPPLIRPSWALDRLMAEYPDRVHAVSVNFVRAERVVRHWRLWESARFEKPGQDGEPGEQVWALLPAAQLQIQALERGGRPIPWTPERLLAPGRRDDPPPLAANDRCGQVTADFRIGRWMQEAFDGRCYQQDAFTDRDCGAAKPDCERRPAGLKKKANRVFFYWEDFYWNEGGTPRPHAHLYHVPARFLWRTDGQTPEEDPSLERLHDFSERAKRDGTAPGIAIIGASYAASHDIHRTPTRKGEMPGPLLLANAIATMRLHGPLQEMGARRSLLAIGVMIVLFSASLTWVPVWFETWRKGRFNARRKRVIRWFGARIGKNGARPVFGLPAPEWLSRWPRRRLRSCVAGLAVWRPDARTPAFWLVILLFLLLTWFLLVARKTWFDFTLTVSFMYCLLEVRSAAMWWALVLLGVAQLLL